MRVISKKTLKDFYEQNQYIDSKESLEAWHKEVLKADWENRAKGKIWGLKT
jgi:mRNA interferase HigB